MDTAVIDRYIQDALKLLEAIDPVKVILFGSSAKLNATSDSDLDFLVVLNEDKLPTTYEEKLGLKVRVREALLSLNNKIAIDLIVYTIPEYDEFRKIDSAFCKDIHDNGKLIYEKAS